ncbi:MAG: ROK family glucokinase [Jatrophihabitans sp.]|nr:MAG: ROK family glucokinase [Jatrophihabitans sp.]
MPLAIGVDIGGTKVLAGVVDDEGVILARDRAPTPRADAAATEAVIARLVASLRETFPGAVGVGVGAAAWLGPDRSTVLFSPHLAWRNVRIREALAAVLPLPVCVENDANAAAWGEFRFGGGRGLDSICCLTIGTGLGGGLVLDGRLYRGAGGMAGEPGHMTLVPGGRLCACGKSGCWEMYASGRALARDAQQLATESPAAAAAMLARAGSIADLDGPVVTAAAADGDPAAQAICAAMGRWLGRGMANVAALVDPAVFLVGGGVSAAGEMLLAPAREELDAEMPGRLYRPAPLVRQATLGADAGLIGAADLARVEFS